MRSLRELTEELTEVRLDATNVSLWTMGATVEKHAVSALNDALAQYPVRVQEVYTSAHPSLGVVVMPGRTESILRIEARGTSIVPRQELLHWSFQPTGSTKLLYLHDRVSMTGALSITYIYDQPHLPAKIFLVDDSVGSVNCSASGRWAPDQWWPEAPGYVEIASDTAREVARYEALTPTGFSGLVRGVEGPVRVWQGGETVSFCIVADEVVPMRAVMLQAQANMYEFWVRHRALYDQYVAQASQQALELTDILGLISNYEMRARIAHDQTKKSQPNSSARLRRPYPR